MEWTVARHVLDDNVRFANGRRRSEAQMLRAGEFSERKNATKYSTVMNSRTGKNKSSIAKSPTQRISKLSQKPVLGLLHPIRNRWRRPLLTCLLNEQFLALRKLRLLRLRYANRADD